MKVRRFFFVLSQRSLKVHVQYGKVHTEGKTACGRVVSKGWLWFQNRRAADLICKQCEKQLGS